MPAFALASLAWLDSAFGDCQIITVSQSAASPSGYVAVIHTPHHWQARQWLSHLRYTVAARAWLVEGQDEALVFVPVK